MNVRQILAGIALAAMVTTADIAQAQRRPAGTASLAEMPCQKIEGKYFAMNKDISVGLEIFRAVARLSHFMDRIHDNDDPVRVVCRLAAAGQSPRYRTLTLAFGFRDDDYNASSSSVRLAIYKDGNLFEYRDITGGEKLLWSVDVSGTRSLALEATCLRTSRSDCAAVYFVEDILEE